MAKREEMPESIKKGIILWCLKHIHLNKNPGSSSNLSVCFTPILMKSLTFFIHCHRIDSKFHQGATSRLNHWALKLHMQSVWLPSWGLWAKPYCQILGLTFLKTSLKLDSCRKRIKPPGEGNTHHPIHRGGQAAQESIASCILAVREEAEETATPWKVWGNQRWQTQDKPT